MPYPEKIASVVEAIESMADRDDRIQALISLSKRFRPVPETFATRPFDESHRVPGCESEAFVWVENGEEGLQVEFAVENPQGISAMALAAVLKQGLDGVQPAVAEGLDDDIVYRLFGTELSMGKSLGLTNMVRAVRSRALALARH